MQISLEWQHRVLRLHPQHRQDREEFHLHQEQTRQPLQILAHRLRLRVLHLPQQLPARLQFRQLLREFQSILEIQVPRTYRSH
jgi:hypothetical protein